VDSSQSKLEHDELMAGKIKMYKLPLKTTLGCTTTYIGTVEFNICSSEHITAILDFLGPATRAYE
jgi:hypothetical protein